MDKYRNSTLSPGSEFRPTTVLQNLFHYHKDWLLLCEMLTKGISYPMENPPDDKTRLSDIKAMMTRGNHKSALTLENRTAVQKTYINEVLHGWLIFLLRQTIFKIKVASVISLGVADQFTINEKGERTIKRRVTHDCTFSFPSGDYRVKLCSVRHHDLAENRWHISRTLTSSESRFSFA